MTTTSSNPQQQGRMPLSLTLHQSERRQESPGEAGNVKNAASVAQEFLTLLERQVAIYGRLKEAGAHQRKLIVGDDTPRLLDLLSSRKRLTDELETVSSRLTEVRRSAGDGLRSQLSAQECRQADALLTEAREALRTLIGTDAEDVKLLATRRAQVAESLRAVPQRRAALSAYGTPNALRSGPGAPILDRMDEEG
ncbi:MAG: hypothetical protein IID39_08985 [Planctomycetes bacterium]|nr:hypothetical protein [Planctomycetota bacterium]